MPDGSARLDGWRWRASGAAGISRQRREGFGSVAGCSAAWLQFFRGDRAEHDRGEILPFPAAPGGGWTTQLSGWTGRMDMVKSKI